MNYVKYILVVLALTISLPSYVVSQEISSINFERDSTDTTTTKKERFLEDAPFLTRVPGGLTFSCRGRSPGYYSDVQTSCQVYHLCMPDSRSYTLICGIGTVFNQRTFVCDHHYNYRCQDAEVDAKLNDDLWEDFLLPKSGRPSSRHENRVQEYYDDEDENVGEEEN